METGKQSQEQYTSPPVEPERLKSHRKLWGYGFLLVVFVVAVAGVYIWQTYQEYRLPRASEVVDFETCFKYVHGNTDIAVSHCKAPDGTIYENPSWIPVDDPFADWETYTNKEFGFEFKYPDGFAINVNNDEVVVSHSIPYTHDDSCDLKGETAVLNEVIDFNATIQVFNKDLESTVNETYTFSDDLLENGRFKLSPGFVDDYSAGSLSGHRVNIGAEGCGVNMYYFPIGAFRTVLVSQEFSAERTPQRLDYEKFLALPGIFPPEEESQIFNQVLSTFKFLENN